MFNMIPNELFTQVFQLACCALAMLSLMVTFFLVPRS
ncbi:hypothetical protein Pla144_28450 [Bythopirellula polymerisocia]|uniref:Uncharacterized protein n=1 Tax=Bythopirellula polymerisocia TaxID=2528003 RepID=A0A5C6CPV5_9BACT|nr:hypothetical protein Pla144_28450 [Bythopirellula polymerisocia]